MRSVSHIHDSDSVQIVNLPLNDTIATNQHGGKMSFNYSGSKADILIQKHTELF